MRTIDLVLTEMRDLRADTQAGFRAVNGRIDEGSARLDGLNARLDTGLEGTNTRLDGLNARLDTVIDALADLRSDFERRTHEA